MDGGRCDAHGSRYGEGDWFDVVILSPVEGLWIASWPSRSYNRLSCFALSKFKHFLVWSISGLESEGELGALHRQHSDTRH